MKTYLIWQKIMFLNYIVLFCIWIGKIVCGSLFFLSGPSATLLKTGFCHKKNIRLRTPICDLPAGGLSQRWGWPTCWRSFSDVRMTYLLEVSLGVEDDLPAGGPSQRWGWTTCWKSLSELRMTYSYLLEVPLKVEDDLPTGSPSQRWGWPTRTCWRTIS